MSIIVQNVKKYLKKSQQIRRKKMLFVQNAEKTNMYKSACQLLPLAKAVSSPLEHLQGQPAPLEVFPEGSIDYSSGPELN